MAGLKFNHTDAPAWAPGVFTLQPGDAFDAHAYAEAMQLDPATITPADVMTAQAHAAMLQPGQWLEVCPA